MDNDDTGALPEPPTADQPRSAPEPWTPAGGELFIHSHFYESQDGAEREGWDGILSDRSVKVADAIASIRRDLKVSGNSLLPNNKSKRSKMVRKVSESMKGVVQMPKGSEPKTRGEFYEVSEDLKTVSLKTKLGKKLLTINIVEQDI